MPRLSESPGGRLQNRWCNHHCCRLFESDAVLPVPMANFPRAASVRFREMSGQSGLEISGLLLTHSGHSGRQARVGQYFKLLLDRLRFGAQSTVG